MNYNSGMMVECFYSLIRYSIPYHRTIDYSKSNLLLIQLTLTNGVNLLLR